MDILLFLIVALSALFFGSVEHWSLAFIGILTAASFILFVLKADSDSPAPSGMRVIIIMSAAVLVYPLIQLIPLPLSVLGLVHPTLKDLVTITPNGPPAFHSISIYPFATEMYAARGALYLMVFWMAAVGIDSDDKAHRLIKALAIFGFALALFGLIQKALWTGQIYWFRELTHGGSPFGPFVNRNHFAGFVGMIVPLAFGIALWYRTDEKKLIFGFLAVVMTIAIIFSLSRGGMASFVAGILVFAMVVFSRFYSISRVIPVGLFLAVVLAYLIFLGIAPIVERFAESGVTDASRLLTWQATLDAFTDFSVFGSGLGTFQHIFNVYRPQELHGSVLWTHAHNDYLQLLLEGGVVGTAIFGLFLVHAIKSVISHPWKGREIYLKAGFLGSFTSIAMHSVVDFNLHIASNAILFALTLGLAVSFTRHRAGGSCFSPDRDEEGPKKLTREFRFPWKRRRW